MVKYLLNSDSIIFLDVDATNNYSTIAFDWSSNELVKISGKLYLLLKSIWEKSSIEEADFSSLFSHYKFQQGEASSLIENLLRRQILLKI